MMIFGIEINNLKLAAAVSEKIKNDEYKISLVGGDGHCLQIKIKLGNTESEEETIELLGKYKRD